MMMEMLAITATSHCTAPHAHEDRELSHETREARHAHGDQTADDEANRGKRHDLAHAAQLGDLTGVRTVVDHAGDGKEESRHHAVREHLHARAGQTRHG